jgi:8-oxo-dGTP diphosphatase
MVVFAGDFEEDPVKVLLVKRKAEPFAGWWALPGGFCSHGESVEETASRELMEETGLSSVRLEQVKVYLEHGTGRWCFAAAHVASVDESRMQEVVAGDDASEAAWWSYGHDLQYRRDGEVIRRLAFDHDDMVRDSLRKVRSF